jgi:hypothetical protein
MARGSKSPPVPTVQLTPEQMRVGIERLGRRVTDLEAFDVASISNGHESSLRALEAAIEETLARVFGQGTADYQRYTPAGRLQKFEIGILVVGPGIQQPVTPVSEIRSEISGKIANSITLLRQAILGLEEDLKDAGPMPTPAPKLGSSNKIFVVHGRDDGPREAVARFLERLGLEPVILHEQANQGRTVIEKVVAHSDVGFAVVLLTPDDEGGLKGEVPQARARQNVVLELGFFIGKLGRDRVCTLKVGDLEIPSDWRGVVDEPFDAAGAWRQTLARELQAAKYDVDWNKVMRP